MNLKKMGQNARHVFPVMAAASSEARAAAVHALAVTLHENVEAVRAANQADIDAGRAAGLSEALIDRLTLTPARLEGLTQDVHALAEMPDPVGDVFDERVLPNGLKIRRQRVPLGVMGVIYESRPNVTIDIAALCIKTGNVAILRGGKETINTNRALMRIVHEALQHAQLPLEAIQFVDSPDRAYVSEMLRLNVYIDVIIPRGGNRLHQVCRDTANIPVITGGIGICHIYVDKSADLYAALPLIHNAKTQRPSVCNSLDTLLVHEAVADKFIPTIVDNLSAEGVTFRAGPEAYKIVDNEAVHQAGPEDFDTEWLSLVLGLKVVSGLEDAVAHIHAHSTNHSDGILTEDSDQAAAFIRMVDSAAVFVNASTRFNDGGQLGLGAEVAVSTQRLHARGPMGLPELTTYKWVVEGEYTSRS